MNTFLSIQHFKEFLTYAVMTRNCS